MLIKPRLKALMEKNQEMDNYCLTNAVRGWMLWTATRDTFWYFFCLHWLNIAESGEAALTNSEA